MLGWVVAGISGPLSVQRPLQDPQWDGEGNGVVRAVWVAKSGLGSGLTRLSCEYALPREQSRWTSSLSSPAFLLGIG